jgi:hypothetical protein
MSAPLEWRSRLNGALWLRLSACAYNEIGDYERLAELLPGVLGRLKD